MTTIASIIKTLLTPKAEVSTTEPKAADVTANEDSVVDPALMPSTEQNIMGDGSMATLNLKNVPHNVLYLYQIANICLWMISEVSRSQSDKHIKIRTI